MRAQQQTRQDQIGTLHALLSKGNQITTNDSHQCASYRTYSALILKMHLLDVVGHFVGRDGTLPWYLHWTCINTKKIISKYAWNAFVQNVPDTMSRHRVHSDSLNRAAVVHNRVSKAKQTSLLCGVPTECWLVWQSLIQYERWRSQ